MVTNRTYVRRNTPVNSELHPAAFFPQSQCGILFYMPRKSMPSQRFRHRTFFREWREHRQFTQAQLAARLEEIGGEGVPTTTASLSRLENGKQPYSQQILEALAYALGTDPASLLMRNPLDTSAIWSIWDQASQGERQQIEKLADVVVKYRSGTDG